MLDDKLSEIPVFLNLEKQQLYELNTWLTRSDFPAGATILKEGEPSVGLYVLIKGDVDVLRKTHGREIHVATLQAPSVLGEMGVLISEARTAEVRATTGVTLGFLPSEVFEAKLAENNVVALRIALNLGRIACQRLRSTTRKQTEITEMHAHDSVHV